ncbi:MAG: hypothetical protein IMZ61_11225 [Planctomycetes bacterium]|nr:hypothetical protein [Planctomycetota bacterium]
MKQIERREISMTLPSNNKVKEKNLSTQKINRQYFLRLRSWAGCAIGDAFGIRVEMMHYLDIEEQYDRVDHFGPLPPRKPSKQLAIEQWQP